MHSVDLKLLICNVIVLLTEQQIVNKVVYSRHCTLICNNNFFTLITFFCSVGITHGRTGEKTIPLPQKIILWIYDNRVIENLLGGAKLLTPTVYGLSFGGICYNLEWPGEVRSRSSIFDTHIKTCQCSVCQHAHAKVRRDRKKGFNLIRTIKIEIYGWCKSNFV